MRVPQKLRGALPADVALEDCQVTTYAAVPTSGSSDVDDDAVIVILPGWHAYDGNAEIEYDVATGAEAADAYVEDGDWGDCEITFWVRVTVWRVGYALDTDGDVVEVAVDEDSYTVEIEPDEPECTEERGDDHEWESPFSLVGGLRENPGVWGHGAGVVYTEVCRHCGAYRTTDTWAQDPETGVQGLRSVAYRDPDDASTTWVEKQIA